MIESQLIHFIQFPHAEPFFVFHGITRWGRSRRGLIPRPRNSNNCRLQIHEISVPLEVRPSVSEDTVLVIDASAEAFLSAGSLKGNIVVIRSFHGKVSNYLALVRSGHSSLSFSLMNHII